MLLSVFILLFVSQAFSSDDPSFGDLASDDFGFGDSSMEIPDQFFWEEKAETSEEVKVSPQGKRKREDDEAGLPPAKKVKLSTSIIKPIKPKEKLGTVEKEAIEISKFTDDEQLILKLISKIQEGLSPEYLEAEVAYFAIKPKRHTRIYIKFFRK